MPRHILPAEKIHPAIRERVESRNRDLVEEVMEAIANNDHVVVGMSVNPACRKACKQLEARSLPYKYLEYGGYHNNWRRRNALKMWTGWPTFPMVFQRGVLVGGAEDLVAVLEAEPSE